ncbi:MAG: hypothetical protein AVDCRST_MAG89-286, partial [uncultured Gemmatimonadetes bacterium]
DSRSDEASGHCASRPCDRVRRRRRAGCFHRYGGAGHRDRGGPRPGHRCLCSGARARGWLGHRSRRQDGDHPERRLRRVPARDPHRQARRPHPLDHGRRHRSTQRFVQPGAGQPGRLHAARGQPAVHAGGADIRGPGRLGARHLQLRLHAARRHGHARHDHGHRV